MKTDMRKWFSDMVAAKTKRPLPILSFPATQLLGLTVRELLGSGENQARGMQKIVERVDPPAALGMMDLSVEAEAFGSEIRYSDDEVPTVMGRVVATAEDADALRVPDAGAGRTAIHVDAIARTVRAVTDRPVFACMIGPFSLAGRLMDVSEAIMNCYDEPEMVRSVLEKTTGFLTDYAREYKKVGANGVFIAEPLAGVLSPALIDGFSSPYVKRIVDALQSDDFAFAYHNCGQTIPLANSIVGIGATAYHFGNAIDMEEMLKILPEGTVAMGNVDPAGQFRNGTPESIRAATLDLLERCSRFPSFIPSSGCDIPPLASWDNIDAFFAAVREFYGR